MEIIYHVVNTMDDVHVISLVTIRTHTLSLGLVFLFSTPPNFTILTTEQYCIVNSNYTPCNGPKGDYQLP